jgi:drug/metabolite transporter (DMT)-like permease
MVACSIALVGAVLLALDGTSFDAADGGDAIASLLANGSFVGDMITGLSALFYAVCMVRIHQKTQDKDSTALAVDKVFFAGVISMVWVLGDLVYEGGDINSFWPNYKSIEQWLLLLFISVGPSALSNVLQFKALSTLKPSEGQVILATVPLWAVGFSFLTLGNTVSMGLLAYGGLLMICSSFLSLWLVNLIEE